MQSDDYVCRASTRCTREDRFAIAEQMLCQTQYQRDFSWSSRSFAVPGIRSEDMTEELRYAETALATVERLAAIDPRCDLTVHMSRIGAEAGRLLKDDLRMLRASPAR